MLSALVRKPNNLFTFAHPDGTKVLFWVDSESRQLFVFSTIRTIGKAFEGLFPRFCWQHDALERVVANMQSLNWHFEPNGPQWVHPTLNAMECVLRYMSATEARSFVLNTQGQIQLNAILQRSLAENSVLWEKWYQEDFPDLYNGQLPKWIDETVGEFSKNQWRRHYMWTHYFIMKGMRRMIELKAATAAINPKFGTAEITLIDINRCQLTHRMRSGKIFAVLKFRPTQIGIFLGEEQIGNRCRLILECLGDLGQPMMKWLYAMLDPAESVILDRFPRKGNVLALMGQEYK